MTITISNTLTGREEPFETLEPGKVKMYVCGPTVYDAAHIGHAMSAMVFDVIRRYLEYAGYEVIHAQNFTDVDDKIIMRAATLGTEPEVLAQQLVDDWLDETARLNIKPATIYPRATHEIGTIQEMIAGLIDEGHAYAAENGDVYFRVTSFPGYGKLSNRDLDEMQAGARIDIDPYKENPLDFALWKAAKPGEPWWESPWGRGRPGWHIECSAMIYRHFGGQIDIHGGGSDLVFPHHENEIAQSEAFMHGSPLARYWVHNGLLQFGGEKMSKSVGNLVTIRDLLAQGGGETFRFMVLSSHYRNPLTYSEESYDAAQRGLARLQGALRSFDEAAVPESAPEHPLCQAALTARERFESGMNDDFNTPVALSALFDLARTINREQDTGAPTEALAWAQATLKELSGVLGLRLDISETQSDLEIEPFINLLIEVRQSLRERKQWDLSDRIRDALAELGVQLEDSAEGTTWRRS